MAPARSSPSHTLPQGGRHWMMFIPPLSCLYIRKRTSGLSLSSLHPESGCHMVRPCHMVGPTTGGLGLCSENLFPSTTEVCKYSYLSPSLTALYPSFSLNILYLLLKCLFYLPNSKSFVYLFYPAYISLQRRRERRELNNPNLSWEMLPWSLK